MVKSGALNDQHESRQPIRGHASGKLRRAAVLIQAVFFDVQKALVHFLDRGHIAEGALFWSGCQSILVDALVRQCFSGREAVHILGKFHELLTRFAHGIINVASHAGFYCRHRRIHIGRQPIRWNRQGILVVRNDGHCTGRSAGIRASGRMLQLLEIIRGVLVLGMGLDVFLEFRNRLRHFAFLD
jgi:hypothetical protein